MLLMSCFENVHKDDVDFEFILGHTAYMRSK